jgi:hypothetical protein
VPVDILWRGTKLSYKCKASSRNGVPSPELHPGNIIANEHSRLQSAGTNEPPSLGISDGIVYPEAWDQLGSSDFSGFDNP